MHIIFPITKRISSKSVLNYFASFKRDEILSAVNSDFLNHFHIKFSLLCSFIHNIPLIILYSRWLHLQVICYLLVHRNTCDSLISAPQWRRKKKLNNVYLSIHILWPYTYITTRRKSNSEKEKRKKNVYHPPVHWLLTTLSFSRIRSMQDNY